MVSWSEVGLMDDRVCGDIVGAQTTTQEGKFKSTPSSAMRKLYTLICNFTIRKIKTHQDMGTEKTSKSVN